MRPTAKLVLKATAYKYTQIKDVALTCINPLAHTGMQSPTIVSSL